MSQTTKVIQSETSEYHSWERMRRRCNDPKHHNYSIYGGRGIKICERWLASFQNFLDDLGPKPSPEYTIERINNNGNYEPSNCKWATKAEQNRNRSNSYTTVEDGKIREAVALKYSYQQMADHVGRSLLSVQMRLHKLRKRDASDGKAQP